MSNNLDLEKRNEVMKTLWKRPEGIFGTITGIGLIGAIGYGLYKLLPYLLAFATNLIGLIIEGVVLVVLLAVIFNRNTWRNLSLIWYQLNRKILGWIVDLDPISVLKRAIGEMKDNLEIINEKVIELGSINVNMGKKLEEYKTEFDRNTRLKKKIEEKLSSSNTNDKDKFKYRNELNNVNNSLVRGQNQIIKQQQRLKTSTRYHEIMEKLAVCVGYKVQDAENDLYYKEEEFKQAKASRSAMKSIMGIFKGGMTETLEQEMALETINDTVNMSLAEMKSLIDGSNDILASFELETDINAEKAEKLLQQYESDGFAIFDRAESDDTTVNSGMFSTMKKQQKQIDNAQEAEYVFVENEETPRSITQKYFN